MNKPYTCVNQPHVTLTCTLALHAVFGVQLYKNYKHMLLLHILSIVNSDWLQYLRSVVVYELGTRNENSPKNRRSSHG